MINSRKLRGILRILAIAILFVSMTSAAMAEVIVVANKDVPVAAVDIATLRDIYLGKKAIWSKNIPVVVTILKSGAANDEFLMKYIGKTSAQFQSYWNKILFTGAGTPPVSFNSESALVEYVAKTRGAVGYINSTTPHDSVKVLKVQ